MSHGSMRYFEKNSQPRSVNHTRIDGISSIRDKYVISDDILGEGSFGVVYKATNISTGERFAMKTIEKQALGAMANKMLEREVAILKRVEHPHIVALEEVYETSEHLYLFLELCDGGELKSLVDNSKLTEQECAKIIQRLASAMAYLHDNDIVHRDLKLENILLSGQDPQDQFNIKVTDFGLSFITGGNSTFGSDKMMTTTCGTPLYMAPEILDNSVGYSHQCDIWSIGIIMYILLSRATPFVADNEEDLYEMIKAGDVSFDGPEWEGISPAAISLIKRMVKVNPADRITAKEIKDHYWVTGEEEGEEGEEMTVIQMMKLFHRESRSPDEQESVPSPEIKIEPIVDQEHAEEKKDIVREAAPRKKFITPNKRCPPVVGDNRRMSCDPNMLRKTGGALSPRRTSLPHNNRLTGGVKTPVKSGAVKKNSESKTPSKKQAAVK